MVWLPFRVRIPDTVISWNLSTLTGSELGMLIIRPIWWFVEAV
ncbi:UNVERIFIED_CONTAM: hypothetical protein GTU68_062908 [Idotea baltica]|nr:hypothetical protein [Idotea baltica]